MRRDNQSRRGFSRGRNVETREIAIRFLIVSEDTKSSTDYFKALIKEVQAACSGSKVVGIAKNSMVKGCGMSTTSLLKEAKKIRDSELTSFAVAGLSLIRMISPISIELSERQQTQGLRLLGQMRASSFGISSTSDIRIPLSHEISVRKPLRQKYRSVSPALGTIRVAPPCTPSSLSLGIKVKP